MRRRVRRHAVCGEGLCDSRRAAAPRASRMSWGSYLVLTITCSGIGKPICPIISLCSSTCRTVS